MQPAHRGISRTSAARQPGMRLHTADGLRKYLTAGERDGFLGQAERAARPVRMLCMTLAYAGCRLSEALALTADRVDLAAGVLTFESLKKRRTGVFRSVPVPPALLDALDMVHGIRELQTRRGRGRGVHLWPWSVFRRGKLTPLILDCWAACFVPEQVLGDAGCGDGGPNTARAFCQGKPIREIARDLGISRNTVRKVLRSGKTAFAYERDVQPQPKLGRWKSDFDRILMENAAKPARERLTLIRLFEDLRGLGYAGGYDAVRRYARSWQRAHASQTAPAFVPLSFA